MEKIIDFIKERKVFLGTLIFFSSLTYIIWKYALKGLQTRKIAAGNRGVSY